MSLSLFYNLYDDIRTTEFTGNPLPIRLRNSLEGETYGVEAWLTQQLSSRWRLSLGAASLHKDFRLKNGAVDLANRASLGADPDFRFVARTEVDLSDRLHAALGLRAMDDLGASGVGGYVEADAWLGWRLSDEVELYAAGSNLLHARHVESNDPARAQSVRRSLHVGTRLSF